MQALGACVSPPNLPLRDMRAAFASPAFLHPLHAPTVTKAVIWRRVVDPRWNSNSVESKGGNNASEGSVHDLEDIRARASALDAMRAARRSALPGARAPFDSSTVVASESVRGVALPDPNTPAKARLSRPAVTHGYVSGGRSRAGGSTDEGAGTPADANPSDVAIHEWRISGDVRIGKRVLLSGGGSGDNDEAWTTLAEIVAFVPEERDLVSGNLLEPLLFKCVHLDRDENEIIEEEAKMFCAAFDDELRRERLAKKRRNQRRASESEDGNTPVISSRGKSKASDSARSRASSSSSARNGKRPATDAFVCHACPSCRRKKCGICHECKGMLLFGGSGTSRQPCSQRVCSQRLKAVGNVATNPSWLNELSASCGGGWQTIDLHSGHLKASRGKGSSRRFFCAPNLFTQFRIRADVEVSELNVLQI